MIKHQTFKDYETYTKVQGGKAIYMREKLIGAIPSASRAFSRIFNQAKPYMNHGTILCLGARSGAEVLGAGVAGFVHPVGIDLHPVGDNVLKADWHDMPFLNKSFANVFTNSLDHCFDFDKLINEIKRVLVDNGVFFFYAPDKQGFEDLEERMSHGGNEAMYWQKSTDIVHRLNEAGFNLIHSWKNGKNSFYIMKKM